MTENKEKRVRGTTQNVLTYLTSNADRPITLRELERECLEPGGVASSVNGAALRLTERYPNCERIQNGVYIWHSNPEVMQEQASLVTVRILKTRDDGSMLVIDDDTNEIYTVRPLSWE